MEKATAELDAVVFNYIIDDDDDVEVVETAATAEEPKLDTSFDENQNPKSLSEAPIVEDTPKKEKDLVILLENQVLSPSKFIPIKLEEPDETTIKVESSSVKTKRAGSFKASRDLRASKAKKVKTKDAGKKIIGKELNDTLKSKKLESLISKRGRQDANVGAKTLEIIKPKRGRPKKADTSVAVVQLHPGTLKKTQKIGLGKQDDVPTNKDATLVKPKRGRPLSKSKGLTNKIVDISGESKTLEHVKPKKVEKRGSKSKQLDVSGNISKSRPLNIKEIELDTEQPISTIHSNHVALSQPLNIKEIGLDIKQPNSAIQSDNVALSKPKRGRPKVKKDNTSVSNNTLEPSGSKKPEVTDLATKQADLLIVSDNFSNDSDSSKALTLKALGLEAKQVVGAASIQNLEASNSQNSKEKAPGKKRSDVTAKCTFLVPSKGRRQRLKESAPKKVTFSLTNKHLEAKETDLETQQTKSSGDIKPLECLEPKIHNELIQIKPDMTNANIMDSKVEATKSDISIVNGDVNLKPPKAKRGRPKGWRAKKPNPVPSVIDLEPLKTQKIGITNLKSEEPHASASTNMKNLQTTQSKTPKIKKLKLTKINDFFTIAGSHSSKSIETERQQDAPIETIDLDAPKAKNVTAKKLKARKVNAPGTANSSKQCGAIEAEKGGSELNSHSIPMETIDLEAPKAKLAPKPRAKSLEARKVINVPGTAKGSKSSKGRETKNVSSKGKQQNVAAETIDLEAPKSKKPRAKSLEARKANVLDRTVEQKNQGVKGTQQSAVIETIDLEAPKIKKVTAVNLEARKVGTSIIRGDLNISKGVAPETKGSKGIQQATSLETIDLVGHKVKKSKSKSLKTKDKTDSATGTSLEIPGAKEIEFRSLTPKLLYGTKKSASLQPKKSKKTVKKVLEAKKREVVVEIVDLQFSKLKISSPKKSTVAGKRVRFSRTANKSQPSKSPDVIETIDLEPSNPKESETQRVEGKRNNLLEKTKNQHLPKTEEVNSGVSNNAGPSNLQEIGAATSSKGKRRISISDDKLPKPKKAKTLEVKKVTFGTVKDTKPAKTEESEAKTVEQRHDVSVGTDVELKELEPPKIKEAEVSNFPRKPIYCTIGTQTTDDEEEKIPNASEIKSLETKTSVSSVGTQMLGPPTAKKAEVKDVGRKATSTTMEVIDLEVPAAPVAKGTEGRITADKKLSPTVAKKPFEAALPTGSKAPANKDRTEEDDDEPFKIEDDDVAQIIPATNRPGESQELGVKYETVEQIHTEFKYESQSEHEEMRKRRRGKLGGPMRGRRSAKVEGQTTIDSFFRIVDLNGKIQIKSQNLIYKCNHCLYVGHSKANLERHSLIHRNPDEIIWFHCTECPYKSKYEHQLKSHFLIHLKPDQINFFKCPYCEVKCSRKHNLTSHIRSIHSNKEYSYKCAECDYKTFSKDRLVAHLRRHSKEVHACTLCKFVTKRKEYLEAHFKVKHMEEIPRPFPCDTCSYKGKTKRELDRHYDRMHNKERLHVYECNHCSFNSIYKKNLEYHLLHMHNNSEGFQKFVCGHCHKNFSYKNGLKVHIIRCHIKLPDDDWHKCHECKYRSKDVSTLKRHIKRNHGAPRLHCKLCSFATNRQTSMEAHMKTHEYDNEDILKCPECPYRIIQMSSFLYHMKVIHGKPLCSKEAEQYYMNDE